VGVGDNESGNDPVDRALRIFVYGPLGLACYLKDSAPTFTDLFVSRGKRELDGVRRTVEEKLGFAKPAPPPAPSAQQRVADNVAALTKVAAQATSLAASMAGPVVKAGAGAAANAAGAAARTVTPAGTNGGGAGTAATGETPSAADTTAAPTAGAPADLPISGYDGLSASQVIERLDGMSRGALERVRVYELAHRARRTILASIDQLTS
jgi:hypothetical protein